MKTLHNIFPEHKQTPKKQIQKQKITADYREKNCLVASELVCAGFEVDFQELKVADYIVKDVAIERKTIQDFISSMINNRLRNQLQELQQYKNKILIIEGFDEQELYNDRNSNGVHANSIRGFMLSIVLKYKVPIIFTKNYEDTARFILVLSKKATSEMPLNPRKKSLNQKQQMQYILESFPGVGPKTAKKLLQEFSSIKNIINAPAKRLEKVLGKKAECFKKIAENIY